LKIINKFHALAILVLYSSLLYFYPVCRANIFNQILLNIPAWLKSKMTLEWSPYWTNSAFGGMPTYQLGAKYPHDYIGDIDDTCGSYRVQRICFYTS
jgi:hypothetical protein